MKQNRPILFLSSLSFALICACAQKHSPSRHEASEPYVGGSIAYDDASPRVISEQEHAEEPSSSPQIAANQATPTRDASPMELKTKDAEEVVSSRSRNREAKKSRSKSEHQALAPSSKPVATMGAVQKQPPLAAPPPTRMDEAWNTEGYNAIVENDFMAVASKPLSTFSIDVDTASYSNMRRFLNDGMLPPIDAVRIEEMLNYFSYDYPEPTSDVPFSVTTEVAACPWNPDHRLVHIGLKGKSVAVDRVQPRNLVFLIDVSGSMEDPRKLPLLKSALELLVDQLRPQDRISIVVYAGASGLVLPPTSGSDIPQIKASLHRLSAGGSTNGGQGIQLAYNVAQKNFIKGGINRVILATDGDFNVGITSQGDLTRLIEEKRESGVFLSVLGFGTGNVKDSQMEMLADKGNGNYAYVDTIKEARKVLVDQLGGTLVTIAKDVKIQVEFNPAFVDSYRLVGYENRALADQDFNDDRKDAGEIGAGHTVTALYEITPKGQRVMQNVEIDSLRYQNSQQPSSKARSGELMYLKLRYKHPQGIRSQLITTPIVDSERDIDQSSNNFRFSASVAMFGMLLRNSKYQGSSSFHRVQQLAQNAVGRDVNGYRREFLQLVTKAAQLRGEHSVAIAR